jgi:hypothetical protein
VILENRLGLVEHDAGWDIRPQGYMHAPADQEPMRRSRGLTLAEPEEN